MIVDIDLVLLIITHVHKQTVGVVREHVTLLLRFEQVFAVGGTV